MFDPRGCGTRAAPTEPQRAVAHFNRVHLQGETSARHIRCASSFTLRHADRVIFRWPVAEEGLIVRLLGLAACPLGRQESKRCHVGSVVDGVAVSRSRLSRIIRPIHCTIAWARRLFVCVRCAAARPREKISKRAISNILPVQQSLFIFENTTIGGTV